MTAIRAIGKQKVKQRERKKDGRSEKNLKK
jgi:hypothetical protein